MNRVAEAIERYEVSDKDYPSPGDLIVPTHYDVNKVMREDFVYNAEDFSSDAGDIILAETAEENDALRNKLGDALFWYEFMVDNPTGVDRMKRYSTLSRMASDIGMMIIENTINNGYTAHKLGNYDV